MSFKPVSMSKVNIFLKGEDLEKVINLIYDLKLIEFFKIDEENFERFELEDLNELSGRLLRLRSAIRLLKGYYKVNTKNPINHPIDETIKIKQKLEEDNKKVVSLKDEIKRNKILTELGIKHQDLGSDKLIVGFVPSSKTNNLKLLTKNKIKYKYFKHEKRVYFVTKTTKKIPFKFKDFYLPKKVQENLDVKLEKVKNSIKKLNLELRKIANGNLNSLIDKEHMLTKEVQLLESKPKFSKTENFVVVNGFVPTKKVRELKLKLVDELGDKFDIISKVEKEDAPILLNNSEAVGKFHELLKMYSLPKYNEINPSFFLFLTFPLFFGFILGDVIYGIISLLFFTWLKTKMKAVADFISVFQFSAIMSIFFGIIFGEFMGYEFHGSFYGLLERSHDPEALLIIAVIFGLIHINLGLILGFFNNLHKLKSAICDKLSFIILQAGIGLLAYGIQIGSNTLVTIGSLLGIFAVFLIYLGHGFIGVMEVPSFFTNILSYSRLMAVGLSSVVIAILINDFSEPLFSKGILGITFGIILFTLGHIFNIALGNFEGFLHTLRLHYVEHFTKFYSGGGKEFEPFGQRNLEE